MQVSYFNAFLAIALILLLGLIFMSPSLVWADEADAATAINSFKVTLLNCYSAAKESEAAGANITTLVATLNEAGSLLSRAEFAYASNDFDAALSFAVQGQNTLNDFIEEANTLKETAMKQQNRDFLINVVGSIVGAFAVIVVGFAAWFFLKKRYETAEVDASEPSKL